MSTETRTKRRDKDPVRVYGDGRIAYWTGGAPGEGIRKLERCGTVDAAQERATAVREALALAHGLGPHAAGTLDDAMQAFVIAKREAGAPEGTIRQYKSNWNVWVPEKVGKTRCFDVSIAHWSAIFDHLNAESASESTVTNVARTLGALTEWGVNRGYFVQAEPFGDPRRRKAVVKTAKAQARTGQAAEGGRYRLSACPAVSDVEVFAAAFENAYPGYGRRLVLLGLGTGLRINELLALRHDSIDFDTGQVSVDSQLDRYQAWPALCPPKSGKPRKSTLWACYDDIALSLVEDSLAVEPDSARHGWLFPPATSTIWWADTAGRLARRAVRACEWAWTFHWLRHAFATYSIESLSAGGYGVEPITVQGWLGHERLSTTMDMYVGSRDGAQAEARSRTVRLPG